MIRRIKLLQEYALLLRCRGCGNLLITTEHGRPSGLSCAWKEIVDADLRTSLSGLSRMMSLKGKLICEKCAAQPPIDFSRLTTDQLTVMELLTGVLLGKYESTNQTKRG